MTRRAAGREKSDTESSWLEYRRDLLLSGRHGDFDQQPLIMCKAVH